MTKIAPSPEFQTSPQFSRLSKCPAPPFKLVFWLQIHISRQDCCKNFGHRFFQRIPQLNPMLNKWKSSWSRLLGQGSLKLHQQFCLAPIVGSYFHDLSYFANARDDEFDDDIFHQILDMVQMKKIERATHSDSTLNNLFPNS